MHCVHCFSVFNLHCDNSDARTGLRSAHSHTNKRTFAFPAEGGDAPFPPRGVPDSRGFATAAEGLDGL